MLGCVKRQVNERNSQVVSLLITRPASNQVDPVPSLRRQVNARVLRRVGNHICGRAKSTARDERLREGRAAQTNEALLLDASSSSIFAKTAD
jgi:hypothetical protein